jgi:methyl-accepting chemotaxis protein
MISYMNGSSLQSLTDLTNEIKDVFVGFDASKLIGGDIHQFHKDPERIKRILTDLKEGEVHKGRINLVVLRFQ